MNRITLALKRPFIWLRRFRHRCGYMIGVYDSRKGKEVWKWS